MRVKPPPRTGERRVVETVDVEELRQIGQRVAVPLLEHEAPEPPCVDWGYGVFCRMDRFSTGSLEAVPELLRVDVAGVAAGDGVWLADAELSNVVNAENASPKPVRSMRS